MTKHDGGLERDTLLSPLDPDVVARAGLEPVDVPTLESPRASGPGPAHVTQPEPLR